MSSDLSVQGQQQKHAPQVKIPKVKKENPTEDSGLQLAFHTKELWGAYLPTTLLIFPDFNQIYMIDQVGRGGTWRRALSSAAKSFRPLGELRNGAVHGRAHRARILPRTAQCGADGARTAVSIIAGWHAGRTATTAGR